MTGTREQHAAGPIEMRADPALELRQISKVYQARRTSLAPAAKLVAVRDVSLTVAYGETLGIVGESGCGKSTLGRIALTLLRPTHGQVIIGGVPSAGLRGTELRRLRRSIQAVFQDPAAALNPRLTIGQSIAEPLRAGGMRSRAERRVAIAELMATVGLDPSRVDARPRELSGGQRQRVVIARALAPQPMLLMADEPVSALDVSVQAQVLNLFRDLQQQRQLSCVFISHDLAVVGFVADRIAVMYLGEVVELGVTRAVLDAPAHPYTRELKDASLLHERGRTGTHASAKPVADAPSPDGCPYRLRCPIAQAICEHERPVLREVSAGRWAACHFAT